MTPAPNAREIQSSAAVVDDQIRRRSVGARAARSVLLTILGEFMLGTGKDVWHETLVATLETQGYRIHTARQALARSISGGWLTSERRGRRSRVRMTEQTEAMVAQGGARIFSFGAPWDWDEHWLLVALRVPEKRRDLRHQVRARLTSQGFGSLGGGLWLSPHLDRERELSELRDQEEVELTTFHAELGELGDPEQLAAEAWDLEAVAAEYAEFIGAFSHRRPTQAAAVFRAEIELVHEWRKFAFLDPDLPEELLPRAWPRPRALAIFEEKLALWRAPAQAYFDELEAAGGKP